MFGVRFESNIWQNAAIFLMANEVNSGRFVYYSNKLLLN